MTAAVGNRDLSVLILGRVWLWGVTSDVFIFMENRFKAFLWKCAIHADRCTHNEHICQTFHELYIHRQPPPLHEQKQTVVWRGLVSTVNRDSKVTTNGEGSSDIDGRQRAHSNSPKQTCSVGKRWEGYDEHWWDACQVSTAFLQTRFPFPFFLFFLPLRIFQVFYIYLFNYCVCLPVWLCVCVCVLCGCACRLCVCRCQRSTLEAVYRCGPSCVFDAGSLPESGTCWVGYAVWPDSPRDPCDYCPRPEVINMCNIPNVCIWLLQLNLCSLAF